MPSLSRPVLSPKTWTDISGDMTSGTSYALTLAGPITNARIKIAEAAETPTSATSTRIVRMGSPAEVKYTGVPIWACAETSGLALDIVSTP